METLPVHVPVPVPVPVPPMEIAIAAVSSEIVEESQPCQHKAQLDAVSEMGLLPTENKAENFVTIDMPPIACLIPEKESIWDSSPAEYVAGASSGRNPNSECQIGTLSMEEVAVLALGDSSMKSPLLKPASAINRATSLPAIPFQPLIPSGTGEYLPIYRSRSVPVSYTDVTMTEDHVRVLCVVPNRRSNEWSIALLNPSVMHSGGEDQDTITEDEAVCRICFEELGEDLNNFRLECDCKGDLALVHRHCSQRWFNIRGTRTCEICGKRVRNVTVRITRRINTSILNQFQPPPMTYTDMIWHGILLLFVVSMMAYTLSIELIKTRRSGENTNEPYGAVSASVALAVFTSATASAVGQWKDVWIYALAQYVVFTVFAGFFYDLCRLGPIPTLFLATFFAVGIGRGAEPAYHAFKKWRQTRLNQANNNPQEAASQIEIEPTEETNESHRSDANLDESNKETDESYQSERNEETEESHQSQRNEETDDSHQSDANHDEHNEETDESHSDANCHCHESTEKIDQRFQL